MAQPSYEPVISSQFVAPKEFNVIVNRNSSGDLVITDGNEKTLVTVISCDSTLHRQRLLQDGNGKPIATIRGKKRTVHDRWNVFRGQSKADSDMIFSTARSDVIQSMNTHVNVFLANKMSGSKDYDFQIKGSWSNRSCAIYLGNSSTIIAQMHLCQSPDRFMVTIYRNVDYAFVVALVATVEAMNSPGKMKVATKIAIGIAGHVATKIAIGVICEL